MEFKDILKYLRTQKGWSKNESAKKIGISYSAYSNYEYGNRKPNHSILKKIAEVFNTTVSYLLGETSYDRSLKDDNFSLLGDDSIEKRKSIGKKIKCIRISKGLTMDEFAKKMDDTAKSGTVSNWETGKNLPNSRRLKRIAELGNTTVSYLLGETSYDRPLKDGDFSLLGDDSVEQRKIIGEKIKCIRISKGLTMKEFGNLFKPPASDSIVSRWEGGKSLPNNNRLKRIAELGNTTVSYLLGETSYDRPLKDGDFSLLGDDSVEQRKIIGEKIKCIRISRGLTMKEFGKKFSPIAAKGAVSNWEKGNYLPNNERLKRIAELGNTTVSYLLEENSMNISLKDGAILLNHEGQYIVKENKIIPIYEVLKPQKQLLESSSEEYTLNKQEVKDTNGEVIKYHDVVVNQSGEILLVDFGVNNHNKTKGLTVVNKFIGVGDWLDVYPDGELEIIGNVDYDSGS